MCMTEVEEERVEQSALRVLFMRKSHQLRIQVMSSNLGTQLSCQKLANILKRAILGDHSQKDLAKRGALEEDQHIDHRSDMSSNAFTAIDVLPRQG